MKSILQTTIFLLGLCLINSCGRQITCPDFDEEILEWVPYNEGDTIKLVNTFNDSLLILPVDHISISHTTHYNTAFKCGTCNDRIYVNSEEDLLNIGIGLNENNITQKGFLIEGDYFEEYYSSYNEYIDYDFEGTLYDLVWVFEKSESIEKYRKLIVARGFGIIGLEDLDGNCWTLQTKKLKSGNSSSVKINNTSCG